MTRGAIILLALLVLASLLGLSAGQSWISPVDLIRDTLGGEGRGALILGSFRAPRVLVALGAGACLGLSGALFQTLLRNPLASPDLLGFNPGAALAVVMATALGIGVPMPLAAAAGGLGAGALVALLAYSPGRATPPLVLILVGLGVGVMATSAGQFAMTRLPQSTAAEAQRWLIGNLSGASWPQVAQVWGLGLALALLALGLSGRLAVLELGEDLAAALGLRVERSRAALALTGVALAATGVSVVGPVAFVALMAGPLGSRLTGARSVSGRLLSAMGAGALILLLADVVGRSAVPAIELPAGIMTGILGAPYLLWRLSREMERGGL
ncbi:MAG: iron ABC transporter permease [Paracoccus sp. (in: a-proteobacteria)]|uniref:FecCD family ABC transporter permease n=1 Tax=Paracoccus sp. TaxID=267 RepID=UPI0039E302F8